MIYSSGNNISQSRHSRGDKNPFENWGRVHIFPKRWILPGCLSGKWIWKERPPREDLFRGGPVLWRGLDYLLKPVNKGREMWPMASLRNATDQVTLEKIGIGTPADHPFCGHIVSENKPDLSATVFILIACLCRIVWYRQSTRCAHDMDITVFVWSTTTQENQPFPWPGFFVSDQFVLHTCRKFMAVEHELFKCVPTPVRLTVEQI